MHTIMKKIIAELKEHKKIYWALAFIVILSAIFRLWNLGEVPFVADEFLDVNATYGYHQTGQWQAWDFNHDRPSIRINEASDERAWLYRIQVAALYDYLPPTETTARLISTFWGILTTIILYGVTLSFTKNRWIALIAAFLWAVSVPAIEIDRKIRMYSMFAPLFLLLSWSVYQFLETGKRKVVSLHQSTFNFNYWYVIPIVLFGVLAMHLHQLTGNIAFVIFVYCLVMGFIVWRRKELPFNRYFVYAAAMILVITTLAFVLPQQAQWFMSTLTFFDDHWSYVGHILRNYWHPLIGVLVIGAGTWHLVAQSKKRSAGIWIALNFFVILLAAIFLWNRNVGPQYIFFIQPFGMILAAAGVYVLAHFLKTHVKNQKVFVGVLIVAVVLLPFYGYFFLANNTYNLTADGDAPDYRKVFDYVKRNASEDDVMITRNFRNYYWGGMDITVYDFGSERSEEKLALENKVKKVTLAQVEEIVAEKPTGWVVFSDNDRQFIEKEARAYFDEHMEKIDDSSLVRGKVSVYRWGNE